MVHCFLNCKLQLCFTYHLHHTPLPSGKGILKFIHFEISNVLLKYSNYTLKKEVLRDFFSVACNYISFNVFGSSTSLYLKHLTGH